MKRLKLLPLAAIALIGCLDGTGPRRPGGPNALISDGAHSGGNTGFFFLPPMVPRPTITAPFNALLQPLVRICRWATGCVSDPIDFTLTTGPGSEVIRVNPTYKHYQVNWHTDQFNVQPGEAYRIQIFADPDGTVLLGSADIGIAATGKEAKNITNGSEGEGETIGLVDGRTLPIRFFAGLSALGLCRPSGPTCAEAVVPPGGGLVVAVNADGEAEAFADFPSGWTDEPTTVMLERLPNDPPPLDAPEGQQQFPLFYKFEAFVSDGEGGLMPAGRFDARVRIGVCNIEDATDPLHPEPRGNMSLGMGGEGKFRTLPLADASDILGICEGITLAIRSGEEAKGWRALLAKAAAIATDVVLPRPLHARSAVVVDGGMGGSTDSFESPVGTVEGKPDLKVIKIEPGEGEDIEVPGFTMSPPDPVVGEPVTFTAVITNVGDLHAGLTFARIDVSGQTRGEPLDCPESDTPLTASLAPDEFCTVDRVVTFASPGAYTATAVADAFGDLASESDEENNEASLAFTVSEPPSGVITFETYPNGTAACDRCDVTNQFHAQGVDFAYQSFDNVVTGGTLGNGNGVAYGDAENLSNHFVTSALTEGGVGISGVLTMSLQPTYPRTVRFDLSTSRDITPPMNVFDGNGDLVPAAQITRTFLRNYTTSGAGAAVSWTTVEVTSETGIQRVVFIMTNYIQQIDNVVLTP